MELFSIRPIEEKDIDIILSLENQCFLAPWKKENIIYELKENPVSNLWGVESNIYGLVGYIDYWITFDSSTICQICVNPTHQRKHLGSMLLNEAIKDCTAQKVRNVTLEVREHNLPAIKLYEKHGFEKVMIKKAYYTNGDNAVYMIKQIQEGDK
ncbi:MAG: ribosomal protein S18-alanine N-acetyltransferase [Bacilli bacterium]|nr:ribosomal protein S18-alanine N-acetyltransferase [Bacilli bacterium]